MEILIRKMSPDDAKVVAEIEKRVFAQPWSADSFLKSSQDDNNIYLVATDENNVIMGYCGLWSSFEEGQINNVCVAPEHRMKGVAKSMLTQLISEGMQKGLTDFTLEVRVSNTGAIHLYEELGFDNEGIRKNFYDKPREDAMIMWLRSLQN